MIAELNDIKHNISKVSLVETLNDLGGVLVDSRYEDEVRRLDFRLKEINDNDRKGLLTPSDLSVEKNKILESIFDLIGRIEKESTIRNSLKNNQEVENTSTAIKKSRTVNLSTVFIVLLIAGIIALILTFYMKSGSNLLHDNPSSPMHQTTTEELNDGEARLIDTSTEAINDVSNVILDENLNPVKNVKVEDASIVEKEAYDLQLLVGERQGFMYSKHDTTNITLSITLEGEELIVKENHDLAYKIKVVDENRLKIYKQKINSLSYIEGVGDIYIDLNNLSFSYKIITGKSSYEYFYKE